MNAPFRGLLGSASLRRLTASARVMQRALAGAADIRRPSPAVDVAAVLDRVFGRVAPSPGIDPSPADLPGTITLGSIAVSAGSRPYRLFVPAQRRVDAPLIVMLHGCTQTAEDFAAGTRMDAHAAAAGALVLYPVQVASANAQRCWNWFNPADQHRDAGEPAIIAAMVRQVIAEQGVDPGRVFAAGLSAGGAQAAILGAAYPDLFAGVGVHSGLACGAATDVAGAFMAMQRGKDGAGAHRMRTIVFHGDRDGTVNVRNAAAVAGQVAATAAGPAETQAGTAPGGMGYIRSIRRDAAGRPAVEVWTVHGLGHAWSGGSAAGSYTEPQGPDASAAMLEFFLTQ